MIPKELQVRYDRCVKKVMASGGKTKTEAEGICELSLTSMKPAPKEKPKPEMVVANAEKDTHFVFSTSSKINAENEGTILRNIEIFKAGTFKGIEFKLSALEKMVANFYVLKSHGIFDHVPVRSDHPGWLGEVGVIDRVGGYVKDLRVVGKKLVADVRITSKEMLEKIKEGSYVQRSAEIGHYRDNNGDTWSPCLWGFAWVDIPAVEGLSPTFSFSQDKNVELVKLNSEDMEPKEGEDKVETPVEEAPVVAPVEEAAAAPVEEAPVEEKVEETVVEEEKVDEAAEEVEAPTEEAAPEAPVEEVAAPVEEAAPTPEVQASMTEGEKSAFAKAFPKEFAELEKFKNEKIDATINELVKLGKVLPAQRDAVNAFVKGLSDEQFNALTAIFEQMPVLVKLNEEHVEEGGENQEKPENTPEGDEPKSSDEKADAFLKETGGVAPEGKTE